MQINLAHYTALFDFEHSGAAIMVFDEKEEFKRRCIEHLVNYPAWVEDQVKKEIETHLATSDSLLITTVKVDGFGTLYLTTHRGHLNLGYNSSLTGKMGIR